VKFSQQIIVLFSCIFTCFDIAHAGESEFKRAEIFQAHERLLSSELIQQEYKLYVNLPKNYHQSNKAYPVVYLLDGHKNYGMLLSVYEQLYYDGDVPGAILIGISWGGKEPNPRELRRRDFTPSVVGGGPETGGADVFLNVIKSEIIPFVENEYRANQKRILSGSSLGGLFTIYAMFKDPELFSGYLATAASAWYADEQLLDIAKDYVKSDQQKSTKLYSAVSKLDGVFPSVKKLHNYLAQQKPVGLEMEFTTLDNLGHSGTKSIGILRGLQYLFARNEVVLSKTELELFTGTYKDIHSGLQSQVSIERGQLTVASAEGKKTNFLSIGNQQFFFKGRPHATIEFDINAEPVTMQISTTQSEQVMLKME